MVFSENIALEVLNETRGISSRVETVENEESKPKSWMFWKKRRYVVGIMAFLGFFNILALRVILSIAIVAMTESKAVLSQDGNVTYVKEFDWDSKQQGIILSSFFYGNITTQLLGGWLAAKYGGKRIFGLGIAVSAALTVVTPFAAKQSFYLLLAVRIIEGLGDGVTYPCHLAICSRWSPPLERTRWVGVSLSGNFVGTIVSMPVCAYLCNAFGWESVFYIFGTVGLLWYVCFHFIVADSPAQDPHISEEELSYITKALEEENTVKDANPPWGQIMKSTPVWGIIAAHFSENWGNLTLTTQLPTFMKDVLHFDLGTTGFLAIIPYLAMAITLQISGVLGDWLQIKGFLSRVQVRKLFTCGGFLAQAAFMTLITIYHTPVATMSFLTIAVGLGAFAYSGFCVNYLDIAPNYASILMGIGNTFSNMPGILSPLLSGYLVTTGDEKEWNVVFYITSGVYLTGAFIYGCLASGKIQKWATEAESSNMKEFKTGCDNPVYC